jgi:preprotein translocase subunit SecD
MCPAAPIWHHASMRLALLLAVAACSKPKLELAFEPTCDADSERFVESIRERVTEKGADTDVIVRGRRLIVTMPKDTPHDVAAELSALVERYARLEIKVVEGSGLGPKVELDGTAIEDAYGSYDANTDTPTVVIVMTPAGSRQMIDLTSRTVGKRLAVLLEGNIKSLLAVTSAPPDGNRFIFHIEGPDQLTRERQRDDLVAVLRVGSLPCPLRALDR